MFLKQNPFVRLLIPFVTGILLQWYKQITLDVSVTIFVSALFFALLFQWLRGYRKFKYQPVQGILIGVLLLSLGMMLTWFKDVRHDPQSLYQTYHQNQALVAVVQEPLSEKERSYKAEARVTHLIQKDSVSLARNKADTIKPKHELLT